MMRRVLGVPEDESDEEREARMASYRRLLDTDSEDEASIMAQCAFLAGADD
jgi:hypothetical protein